MTTPNIIKASQSYVSGWAPPEWDEARLSVFRKAIAPPSASAADVEFFVAWCKRTGLDPFVKQAYFVERRSKGPDGKWSVRHEPMAAESGMAARADVEADFLGLRGGVVYAGDVFSVDVDAGVVTHRWELAQREAKGNRVLGAWAHARRKGRDVPVVWLRVEERIQKRWDAEKKAMVVTAFWEKDTAGMIAKCARAMAYRMAFPNLFSGVFVREEMGTEADETTGPRPVDAAPIQPAQTATARLAAKLGAVVARVTTAAQPEEAATVPVTDHGEEAISFTPPTPPDAEDEPPPRASPPVPDAPPDVTPSGETTAAPGPGPVMPFGKRKGEPLAVLSTVTLEEALDEARKRIASAKGTEGWLASAHEGVRLVQEEVSRRDQEMVTDEDAPF